MRIGVPREIKPLEGRVGLIPAACAEIAAAGHEVFLETGAGVASGYQDEDYRQIGVNICPSAESLYSAAQLVVKVKEPIEAEYGLLNEQHILFSYLHLAANKPLTEFLRANGLTAVAFETVQEADGSLPLLAPMSDIAGRLSVQLGTQLLHRPQGGKGVLLGGLPGAERGHVVIIGAGVAGGNAALLAAASGARVTVFDRKRDRLEAMRQLGPNVTALYGYADSINDVLPDADLVIGAVLIPGAKAPHVISAEQVRQMQPGSVIVDISVDQGGCVETTRPTDYTQPTYRVDDIVHMAVTNMPGAVPRSASQALSMAVLPYLLDLARQGTELLQDYPALSRGINIRAGECVHPALQDGCNIS